MVDLLSEGQFRVQWTLAYLATTGPDHGQISEIASYVNHHANMVYIVSLLACTTISFPIMLSIINANKCRISASPNFEQSNPWRIQLGIEPGTMQILIGHSYH